MGWTLQPGSVGGARTPATGHTCVRGHAVVGRVVTDAVTPLMPPTLALHHNPICPWDASYRWHRAFTPGSLTVRSNEAQLKALNLPSPRPFTGSVEAPALGDTAAEVRARPHLMVPAVSGTGGLRFVARPPDEIDPMSGSASARGLPQLKDSLDAVPQYLHQTKVLPVLPGKDPGVKPLTPGSPRTLTPAHLLRNGLDEVVPRARTHIFSPRRFGSATAWSTSYMEGNAQVHGQAAYL